MFGKGLERKWSCQETKPGALAYRASTHNNRWCMHQTQLRNISPYTQETSWHVRQSLAARWEQYEQMHSLYESSYSTPRQLASLSVQFHLSCGRWLGAVVYSHVCSCCLLTHTYVVWSLLTCRWYTCLLTRT